MAIVTVEKNRYTVESLYQWDKNQVLEIRGLSLPSIPEIHFSNNDMDRAIVRQSTMNNAGVITVDIPNSLLQKPYKITAYVCIYEGETFESLYKLEIPVKARTKPADYTIEDSDGEIYSFNALENKVNNVLISMATEYDRAIKSINNKCDESVEAIKNEVETSKVTINDIVEKTKNELDIDVITEKVNTALTIANGKNKARIFNNIDDMNEWLANEENAGKCTVGDNLYIVDTDVSDYWISEVLTEADEETGFYYKIHELETQKIDIENIETVISENFDNDLKYKKFYIKIVDDSKEFGVDIYYNSYDLFVNIYVILNAARTASTEYTEVIVSTLSDSDYYNATFANVFKNVFSKYTDIDNSNNFNTITESIYVISKNGKVVEIECKVELYYDDIGNVRDCTFTVRSIPVSSLTNGDKYYGQLRISDNEITGGYTID